MPSVSEFFGIMIYIYYNDHAPPHFHAKYAEYEALFQIDTLEIYSGEIPARARALVLEWASLHRIELMEDWDLARQGDSLKTIEPLQ
jgi:hypothetical protein